MSAVSSGHFLNKNGAKDVTTGFSLLRSHSDCSASWLAAVLSVALPVAGNGRHRLVLSSEAIHFPCIECDKLEISKPALEICLFLLLFKTLSLTNKSQIYTQRK